MELSCEKYENQDSIISSLESSKEWYIIHQIRKKYQETILINSEIYNPQPHLSIYNVYKQNAVLREDSEE